MSETILEYRKEQKRFFTYEGRILLVQQGCHHCKLYLGIIEEFNLLLHPEKRIQVIDVYDAWNYGVDLDPIVNHLDLNGTPTLYLGGKNPVMLEGVTTRPYLVGFLKGYLKRAGDL